MIHAKRPVNFYYPIKRALVHKWEVVLSSDGYANYGTGNILTSDGYGPHGFGNINAWCVISKTVNNQQYQFCLQTDGYMGVRLKYSKLGFGSGMDNLGASPTASDQQILLGAGTDMAPIYQQIIKGVFDFNVNKVSISVVTSVNILNFSLKLISPVIIPKLLKPVINKVLK